MTAPPRQAAPAQKPAVVHASDRRSRSRSATRALDVLEYFGEVGHPLRAVEIANALGISASSANQLLKTMVGSAHLLFDSQHKRYVPSPRLAMFGAWIVSHYGNARFRDIIRTIHSEIGKTVSLTTPHDDYMQVVDIVHGSDSSALAERGVRVSVFSSAVGRAYLSTLSALNLANAFARIRPNGVSFQEVRDDIEEIRRNGYAFDGRSDVCALGVALPRDDTGAQFVIGIAGPASQLKNNRLDYFNLIQSIVFSSKSDATRT